MDIFKNNKKFAIFFLASTLSILTSGMTAFSVGVFIFKTSHSAFIKSMISLVSFIPTILIEPFAGLLADRFDRRKLMIIGDSLSIIGLMIILYAIKTQDGNYLLIGLGSFVSSLFASLIAPASKATISDILSKEDYISAEGLLQISNAGKFILSPILAVFVVGKWGIDKVIYIDTLSVFTTIYALAYISKGLKLTKAKIKTSYIDDFKYGLSSLRDEKAIFMLLAFTMVLTFMVGLIEELATPLILSFSTDKNLSITLAVGALGMVFSSAYLGFKGLGRDKVKTLLISSLIAGLAMVGFGLRENLILISISAFVLFLTLPIFNTICNYYIRVLIANDLQGRIFGLMSSLSQIGYLIAYASSGFMAEYVFDPLVKESLGKNGVLAYIVGPGQGRGIGLSIIFFGLVLIILSLIIAQSPALKEIKET